MNYMLSPQTNLSYQICNLAKKNPFKLHKKPRKGMTKQIQTFISNFSCFTCGNFHH